MNKHINEGKKMNIDYEAGIEQQNDYGQKKNHGKN